CISKPFEIDDILNTVKEIISKRMALVITSDASVADFFNANFATCGFFVVCESDLNKALRLAERRKPELVFIDAAYRGSASSVSSAAGSYSKVVLIGQDLQESPGAAFKHISLSKSAVSEFLQSDGKKNASIVSGDTINSNNLKLALTAKGYDTSVFNGEDAFFKGRAAGNCDFIIIDSEASADPEKFCSRIRQCGAAGVIIFIFDYNTPLSEELKKLDVLFLQRPFDSKDVIKLMERQ
ncbi:MAG: hypothetical protein FWC57_00095, partial [Endomicrobia bacterium]|nr:hypothetical protein [Endomicrobiia bacterium]